MIFADHLHEIDFSHAPEKFRNYDYGAIKKYFLQYNESFFKAAYFALAPILIIPLYQQTRTHAAIYGEQELVRSAFWEHEALANYYGDHRFEHPACITQNILKTVCSKRDKDGNATVRVTAHGFRGADRVDLVPVYGGDGRLHNVPVEWIEYLPVEKTSTMLVRDFPEDSEIDCSKSDALVRRSIYSYLKRTSAGDQPRG